MKKILLIISLLVLTACQTNTDSDVLKKQAVTSVALEETSDSDYDIVSQNIASGANDFAFTFSKEVMNSDSKNFITSPYSLFLALGALANGCSDEGFENLKATLNLNSDYTKEQINTACSRMMYDLTKNSELEIANAFFVDDDYEVNKDFAQDLMSYYLSDAFTVDFAKNTALTAVNDYISDKTNKRIENCVDKFDPNTVLALVNTIYFSDQWKEVFDEKANTTEPFASGKEVEFMNKTFDQKAYYSDDLLSSISLDYENGSQMTIILPKNVSAVEVLNELDNDYYQEILTKKSDCKVNLKLPKFTLDSDSIDCLKVLNNLGFNLNEYDSLDKVVNNDSLYVSDITQKANIFVDENGTTASAATVISANTEAMIVGYDEVNFYCNKPFIFIISQKTVDGGNQILFTGIINEL